MGGYDPSAYLKLTTPSAIVFGVNGQIGYLGVFGNGTFAQWTVPGTYYWTAPISGPVRCRLLGGGRGGHGALTGSGNPGHGGHGGGYCHGTWTVVSGTVYTIVIAAGGLGAIVGAGAGDGGFSTFGPAAGPWMTAYGGTLANGPGWGVGGEINSKGGFGDPAGTYGGGAGAGSQVGDGGPGHPTYGGGGSVGLGAGHVSGASPFGLATALKGGPNIVRALSLQQANSLNSVNRFLLEGYDGGGGDAATALLSAVDGGIGCGGAAGFQTGSNGQGSNGGVCGGGGASWGFRGGDGGPGGGGGAGHASAGNKGGGGGGPGVGVLEW